MRNTSVLLACALAGCSVLNSPLDRAAATQHSGDPEHQALYGPFSATPGAPTLAPTPATRSLSAAGAPGWAITEVDLGGDRYRLRLVLDVLHTGGEGEARLIVVQRADALAHQYGRAGFEMLRFEESVRAGWLWGTRVAEAEFRLYQSAAWPAL